MPSSDSHVSTSKQPATSTTSKMTSNATSKPPAMSSAKNRTTKSTFIATGKIRTTKVNFPVYKRKLDPEERKKLAQMRWKKAIRRVKAMLRFQIPLNPTEEAKQVKFAPTYKLAPDQGMKFNSDKVKDIMDTTLQSKLQEYEYSRFTAPKFAKILSAALNDEMKKCNIPRYKFIANVVISENQHQGVSVTSRCAWDDKTDAFATAQVVKPTFIAVASVHGVYFA